MLLTNISGVADSEDIPLNLSREMLQDSALINKLRRVLTNRVIKWLLEEARKDQTEYNKFFSQFGVFVREGVCTDTDNKVLQNSAET